VSDILTSGNFGRSTIPQLNVAYTHAAHGHAKDSDGRFFDFARLIRAQVTDDSGDLGITGEIAARVSTIEHYQGGATDDTNNITYTSTVNSGDVRVPTSEASEALIMYTNSDGNTNGIADGAWKNLAALAITNAPMIGILNFKATRQLMKEIVIHRVLDLKIIYLLQKLTFSIEFILEPVIQSQMVTHTR